MPRKKQTKRPIDHVHTALRHAFVPHKGNQYRPHLVRLHGLAILAVVVLVAQLSYNLVRDGSVLGTETEIPNKTLLADTNSLRASAHVRPLAMSDKLNKAAALKLQDMFTRGYWDHDAPDGTTPWHWVDAAGYDYSYAGENLAKGFSSADAVVSAWNASSTHRDNLLNEHYTNAGFASATGELGGKRTTLVVALYGAPQTGAVLAATPHYEAPAAVPLSTVSRIGVALQTMSPVIIGSLVLAIIATVVALLAHAYRKQLPKPIRLSWRRHHGLYKALGIMALVVTAVALYGGGQI